MKASATAPSEIGEAGESAIKDAVEVELCTRFAVGRCALDVGIGAGRAGIPLANTGIAVTGVDSSVAMLEQCRKLAGSLPIQLLEGDLNDLPFRASSFDYVVGLNALTHVPNWRDALCEWKRVVRPGGRVAFDVYSLDHDAAFSAVSRKGADPRDAAAKISEIRHVDKVGVEELIDACNLAGLRVEQIVPYGLVFGSNHFLSGSLAAGRFWKRVLSWAVDPRILDFCCFLEREFVGALPAAATNRFFVVADAVPDSAANHNQLERQRSLVRALAGGLRRETLARHGGFDDVKWFDRIGDLLAFEPNAVVLARLLHAAHLWSYPVALDDFVPEQSAKLIAYWLRSGARDDAVTAKWQAWLALDEVGGILEHNGVAFAQSFLWDVVVGALAANEPEADCF